MDVSLSFASCANSGRTPIKLTAPRWFVQHHVGIAGGTVSQLAAVTWRGSLRLCMHYVTVTVSTCQPGCGCIAAVAIPGSTRHGGVCRLCGQNPATLQPLAPTTGCGSTLRASKTTESTGSPELDDVSRSLGPSRRFGAYEMRSLLSEVDEHMVSAGSAPVRLVAVGGAAMLARVPGRSTGDIDIVSEGMNDDVRRACKAVAEKHNMAPDWINDGVKGFAVSVELQPERIFTGQRLTLDSAGSLYLLATKLLSGRKSDEDDCIQLIRETGLFEDAELLDLMESAAGVRGLRPRDEYWAKEVLAHARKGRRLRSLRRWAPSLVRQRAPGQEKKHPK